MDILLLLMNRIIDAISIHSLFSAWTRISELAFWCYGFCRLPGKTLGLSKPLALGFSFYF
jgi:hypothetical protein